MWRLHWRRAIFYSAITKRQHVSPLCMCTSRACYIQHVLVHTCTRICIAAASYAYLLTGALFVDNDEALDDDGDDDDR